MNNTETEKAKQHKQRMQVKKARVDNSIADADKEKGILLVLTGNGKGKSSSAFGMVARSLGHDMKVGVAQFVKSRTDTGEEAFLSKQKNVEWHVLGDGFTWETQNLEQDKATANEGWKIAQTMLHNELLDLVVLDELTYPIKYNWLDLDKVLNDLKNRPPMQHVVITGRGAHRELRALADTVTVLNDDKHAYRAGIKAQKGIDL